MMETPRFKVTSLTGFGGDGGTNAHEATSFQVLDTAYCYGLCFESFVRREAERIAAAMNDGDLDAAHRAYRTRERNKAREAGYRQARKTAKGKAG